MKSFVALLIAFLSFNVCLAQESDNKDGIELEQIVVTPYKTAVKYKQIGTDVDILSVDSEYSKGNYSYIGHGTGL